MERSEEMSRNSGEPLDISALAAQQIDLANRLSEHGHYVRKPTYERVRMQHGDGVLFVGTPRALESKIKAIDRVIFDQMRAEGAPVDDIQGPWVFKPRIPVRAPVSRLERVEVALIEEKQAYKSLQVLYEASMTRCKKQGINLGKERKTNAQLRGDNRILQDRLAELLQGNSDLPEKREERKINEQLRGGNGFYHDHVAEVLQEHSDLPEKREERKTNVQLRGDNAFLQDRVIELLQENSELHKKRKERKANKQMSGDNVFLQDRVIKLLQENLELHKQRKELKECYAARGVELELIRSEAVHLEKVADDRAWEIIQLSEERGQRRQGRGAARPRSCTGRIDIAL